jgi:hypothetical protein
MTKIDRYFIDGAKPSQPATFLQKNHIAVAVAGRGRLS